MRFCGFGLGILEGFLGVLLGFSWVGLVGGWQLSREQVPCFLRSPTDPDFGGEICLRYILMTGDMPFDHDVFGEQLRDTRSGSQAV